VAAIDLCSLAEVRGFLAYRTGWTDRDPILADLITRASQTIIREVGREFAPASPDLTRTFPIDVNRTSPYGATRCDQWRNTVVSLAPYDLRAVNTIRLHPESSSPTALAAGDYQLKPVQSQFGTYRRVVLSRSLSLYSDLAVNYGYAKLEIRGAWGFASVPDDVKQACIETVASWMERDVAGLALETEDGRAIPVATQPTFSIPVSARMKLRPFKEWRPFV